MARARMAWHASDVSGVSSDGFHTTGSPHTRATAVFQDQTAAGKLKALMTPTTPSGCQVSISRWPGRSDGMVRPYSCRERPTAKSQMSTISWTSPRASEVILPTSRLISVARSSLCSASSSPSRLTRAPRTGAGTLRHSRKALRARSTASSTAVASVHASELRRSPLIGERVVARHRLPHRRRRRSARAVSIARLCSSAPVGMVVMVFSAVPSVVRRCSARDGWRCRRNGARRGR